MQIIRETIRLVRETLGRPKKTPDLLVRRSTLTVETRVPEGVLLYQTLGRCLVLLSEEEYRDFLSVSERGVLPADGSADFFFEERFLVPAGFQEEQVTDAVLDIARLLASQESGWYRSLTVFTTTDCNARCFYCYENGCEKMTMSEETADRIADEILKHTKRDFSFRLNWFGGEPLLNLKVIDRITMKLRDAGQAFHSVMTSNAYLFDEALAKRAKEEWHLQNVQITLDGTEKNYNERKAFIYREGSAFQRVIRNIGLLSENGIFVKIRLNLDESNYEDLRLLEKMLAERFAQNPRISVYSRLLYQIGDDNDDAYALYHAFQDRIREDGLEAGYDLPKKIRVTMCMADNRFSACVLPDGSLYNCEHFNTTPGPFGQIGSEEKDEAVLSEMRRAFPRLPKCASCAYLPECIRLVHCETGSGRCTAHFQALRIEHLQICMRTALKKIKKMQKSACIISKQALK